MVEDEQTPPPPYVYSNIHPAMNSAPNYPNQHLNDARKTVIQAKHDLVILCGSNGKNLDPNRLNPGKSTKIIPCFKVDQANKIVSDPHFEDPQTLLINVGTNEIDNVQSQEQIV